MSRWSYRDGKALGFSVIIANASWTYMQKYTALVCVVVLEWISLKEAY